MAEELYSKQWSKREAILRRFEQAWQSGQVPEIVEYLPAAGDERLPILIELVHLDLEYRVKAGHAVRIESYLDKFPELRADRAGLLTLIAAEYILRRGNISEYLERFPQYREELTTLLQAESDRHKPACSPLAETALGITLINDASRGDVDGTLHITGYEVLGELGRGGMGVVYRARQLSLNRLVALKRILSGSHVDPELVARFRNEASVVARLQHPNIVQIYDVGDSAGAPYCALELVEGGTLAQQLAGTPQPARAAADIVRILAVAMQRVHELGIVHRDLKPANVLLSREHAAAFGTPKITDFGLAKHLQGAPGQTQSGAILGTPSYMAPEQAAGRISAIGPATDVYALGAILYEMLTGRPPFKGQNAAETLLQLQTEEPLPPRRLLRRLPRDIETICLKCLHKDPARRYASAAGLADDLQRFSQGMPIQARPTGTLERAWRWSLRHQLASSLLATLVVVVAAGLSVTTWFWQRAERERDDAKASFDLTFAAIDEYFTTVSEHQLLNEPGLQPIRKELLEKARKYYEAFVERHGDDPRVRAELAAAYYRLAHFAYLTKSVVQGHQLAQQAETILAQLLQTNPEDKHRRALARVYGIVANLHVDTNKTADAEAASAKALALLEAVSRTSPGDRKAQVDLARNHHTRGVIVSLAGRLEQAAQEQRQAIAILEAAPVDAEATRLLGVGQRNLGNYYSRSGAKEKARTAYQKALTIQSELIAREPAVFYHESDRSRTYLLLGDLYAESAQSNETEAAYQSGLTALERLAQQNPLLTEFRQQLANGYASLGLFHSNRGALDKADQAYNNSQVILQKLVQDHPGIPGFRQGLTLFLLNQGQRLHRAGQQLQALAKFEEARPLMLELTRQYPADATYRDDLGVCEMNIGIVCRMTGQAKKAEEHFANALLIQEKLVEQHPDMSQYRRNLGWNCLEQGMLFGAQGATQKAIDAYQKGIGAWGVLADANPTIPAYRKHLAMGHTNLGDVYRANSKKAEAAAHYQKAADMQEKLVADHPSVHDFRCALGITYFNLAVMHLDDRRFERGLANYDKALAIQQKLVDDYPEMARYRHDLALTHLNMGNAHQRAGNYREAEEFFDKALPICEAVVRGDPAVAEYQSNLALCHYNYGLLFQTTGQSAKAANSYKHAVLIWESPLEKDPGNVTQLRFGRLCADLGRLLNQNGSHFQGFVWHSRAIAAFKMVLQQEPGQADAKVALLNAHWERALSSVGAARHSEALADWKQALALDDGANQAVLQMERAFTLTQMRLDDLNSPADDQVSQEKIEDAWRSAVEQARRQVGNLALVLRAAHGLDLLASSLAKRGQAPAAIPLLQQSVSLLEECVAANPKTPHLERVLNSLTSSCLSLSDAQTTAKLDDEARQTLQRARIWQEKLVEANPKNGAYHAGLAQLARRQKEYAAAIAAWSKALELNPDDHFAGSSLAWLLATCPQDALRDGKRAVALATRAAEITDWAIPDYLGALAGAHAELGRFDDAVNYQLRALEDPAYQVQFGDRARQRLETYRRKQPYREE